MIIHGYDIKIIFEQNGLKFFFTRIVFWKLFSIRHIIKNYTNFKYLNLLILYVVMILICYYLRFLSITKKQKIKNYEIFNFLKMLKL